MEYKITPKNSINDTLKIMKSGDILFLSEGIYKEKVKVTISNISIIGFNCSTTIIENMDYSPKIHIDNKEYNTFRTYTCIVLGDNVSISNVTIRNTSVPSIKYGQAVSLHILGDNFKLLNSKLIGAQDTLLCGPIPHDLTIRYKDFLPKDELQANKPSRQLYDNCYIEGDVDFIFGCGNSIFNNCQIHSIETHTNSYVAAPSHSLEQKYGFTFINCKLTGNAKKHSVFLARPWRDYGKAVFINCTMDDHINPLGWNKWGDSNRDKTCYFAEYSPGVDTTKRLPFGHILTEEDLLNYGIEKIHKE